MNPKQDWPKGSSRKQKELTLTAERSRPDSSATPNRATRASFQVSKAINSVPKLFFSTKWASTSTSSSEPLRAKPSWKNRNQQNRVRQLRVWQKSRRARTKGLKTPRRKAKMKSRKTRFWQTTSPTWTRASFHRLCSSWRKFFQTNSKQIQTQISNRINWRIVTTQILDPIKHKFPKLIKIQLTDVRTPSFLSIARKDVRVERIQSRRSKMLKLKISCSTRRRSKW